MKTIKNIKKFFPGFIIITLLIVLLNPNGTNAASNSDKVIYPLKVVSKLNCRFKEFSTLSSDCKQDLPILNTKDYKKYATQNGGYNDFTRLYTVLWGSSYKYGWDVGNGGHIGTDIATSKGTPVYTIADGKVISAKKDIMEGNMISIQHKINGKYIVSNYLHLSKINVKKGDTIKVGTKIGEVGSTGNSTGNHLHIQIDLKTPFHPYYYDYNKCPFSYYKITENGVCFDELTKNTVDPLLFFETKGAVLNNIKTTTYKSSNTSSEDLSIFDRTVYIGYAINDIKKVQEIFKKIGAYKGIISGNYKDIEQSVINYQIKNKLITNKNSYGAGWFGPKTRFTVKNEYLKVDTTNNTNPTKVIASKIKTVKISKRNLMTREEIEKREVETFLKKYNIELNFVNKTSNIKKGNTEILKLKITDRKGKLFKGNMPGSMTFVVNTEKVSIFPTKLFYFTNGKRDIYLKGLNEGTTNLYIKIGNVVIKTISLKVYNGNKTIYPNSAKILSSKSIVLGEKKTGIILFKSSDGKNLINIPFGSTYNIKLSNDNKICIKKGDLKNIKAIYKSNCSPEDYKNEFNFSYNDTVGGLLLYDYKATSKDFKISLVNNYNKKDLSNKTIIVQNPKGLNNTYAYTNEIIKLLKDGIIDGIKSGYFLENRELTQRDALTWVKKSLIYMKDKSYDKQTNKEIENNINAINKVLPYSSKTKTITRQEYLDITYKYLTFNDNTYSVLKYRDLDDNNNKKIANIFNNNITWKDKFGENYFRPDEKITRGEGVYFLTQGLNRIYQSYLTLK